MNKNHKEYLKKQLRSIPTFEFRTSSDEECLWDNFCIGLSLALHALDDEDFLIIQPKDSKDDRDGYVQFAGFDHDGIRAEVSSEQFCNFPLGKKASRKLLKQLGWNQPTYRWSGAPEATTGSCNYYIDANIGDIPTISRSIVSALRHVLLIKAPFDLEYRSFSNVKGSVHFRSLGIDSVDKLAVLKNHQSRIRKY